MLTSSERSTRAKLAAHAMHARHDPVEITSAARAAYRDSFEKLADPDGVLAPQERTRIASHLRKAHFLRLALLSAQARRQRKEAGAS